ncbi:hypothetical protein Tco_1033831 [Tanacetum coccineum]
MATTTTESTTPTTAKEQKATKPLNLAVDPTTRTTEKDQLKPKTEDLVVIGDNEEAVMWRYMDKKKKKDANPVDEKVLQAASPVNEEAAYPVNVEAAYPVNIEAAYLVKEEAASPVSFLFSSTETTKTNVLVF